jgi:hypothetical protein
MNKFNDELWMFLEKLSNKENFALGRFGDGELTVINKEDFDMIGVGKENEFSYFTNESKYKISRELLEESYLSDIDEYYKGIPCHCCVLGEKAKELFHQIANKDYLTWANIFVNGNYADFNNYLPSVLEGRPIIIVSHKNTNVKSLPFKVTEHIKIESNAWIDSLKEIKNIKDIIEVYELSNAVVLIAGGPFANIAVHELWKWNSNNTYLDVGSTLDPYLFGKPTRQYHANNNPMHHKQCIWLDE